MLDLKDSFLRTNISLFTNLVKTIWKLIIKKSKIKTYKLSDDFGFTIIQEYNYNFLAFLTF